MCQHNTKATQSPICHCCGQPIKKLAEPNKYADYVSITKKWGYFSNKDLVTHTFNLCEACYDNWIKTFKIKVSKSDVSEIFEIEEDE